MLLAHISDLHLLSDRRPVEGRIDTAALLERCVARLLALRPRPDALLVTGDLAEDGSPGAYRLLRELLAPLADRPIHLLPGNHDEREALRAAWFAGRKDLGPAPFLQYAVDAGPLRLVALDTVVPGSGGGALCAGRLRWLDEALAAEPHRPTLVALHHPPFDSGIDFMDRMGLQGREALAEVIGRHPQVERVLCGHLHRGISVRFAGTLAMSAPSCAHQLDLALGDSTPAAYTLEPPALLLHHWDGRRLASHTVPVESAESVPF